MFVYFQLGMQKSISPLVRHSSNKYCSRKAMENSELRIMIRKESKTGRPEPGNNPIEGEVCFLTESPFRILRVSKTLHSLNRYFLNIYKLFYLVTFICTKFPAPCVPAFMVLKRQYKLPNFPHMNCICDTHKT